MKKLFSIIALFFVVTTTTAQENKYSEAAERSSRLTDKEFANEIAALRKDPGFRKIYAPLANEQANPNEVLYNHKLIPVISKEFHDSARFYKIDYGKKLARLEKIYLVNAPLSFLGGVSKDGTTILLNAELEQFPNLMRVILFHQYGKIYGLKQEKGTGIMGTKWEIKQKYEDAAIFIRARPSQKRDFFKALQKKHGLKKQI